MSLAVHEYQLSKFVNNFEKISKSSPQSYIIDNFPLTGFWFLIIEYCKHLVEPPSSCPRPGPWPQSPAPPWPWPPPWPSPAATPASRLELLRRLRRC